MDTAFFFTDYCRKMYHLPLLPGYGPNTNLRSSVPAPIARGTTSYLATLSEAEEDGYQGSYFTQPTRRSSVDRQDGYISSASPVETRKLHPSEQLLTPGSGSNLGGFDSALLSETETWTDGETAPSPNRKGQQKAPVAPPAPGHADDVAEIIFFDYGVVVFFGFTEQQEKDILEDIETAGIMNREINEADWEVEECHFAVRPSQ